MNYRIVSAGVVLMGFLLLAGCSGQEVGTAKTAPLSSADQIKAIESDPKMPPEQKAAAIQTLQQGQARGAAMAQTLRQQK